MPQKLKVYVASPYTKGDVAVNTHLNIEVADRIWRLGYIPYAPLLTHFWHMLFPHPYKDWCELDNVWITCCDIVLRISNHPDTGELLPPSSGADAEVALAVSLGKPVVHSIEELLEKFPSAEVPCGSAA